jgi:hypothetical protein
MKWLATIFVLLLSASTASAGPITFDLLPDGAIEGEAGSTIGWGYTVTNNSADLWLELTSIDAGAFQFATADAAPFDYAIVAPGGTHTVTYDAAAPQGLYQLTWDASAPIGFTNSGLFVLSGMYWDADPFQEGAAIVSDAPSQSAAYDATVSTVPEPGTLLLMGAGAGIGALVRRRRASI